MEELKDRLIKVCEAKLDYYDIVNESDETVEYGLIIEFLFEQIAGLLTGCA